ncbi:MAG: SGNH/GDSL hydrolase family protein [Candidatus Omnitrophota bacterium]|nr:SGNH/GDSL hydrolase family protein [Candidatus Omnitrophota bacterium]MBU1894649.1 SGNH/GDSL hydrolase family protein [Candidatus Omnitrophota bacterium]
MKRVGNVNKVNWFEARPIISKFVLTGFVCLISFVFMEILLCGAEYFQYVKPANRSLFEKYREIYSDERDKEYIFGHHPDVEVLLVNGDNKYLFMTNAEGLRERKNYDGLEKSVIFLGDSIVEGVSVEPDETMDEVFEFETGITALNFGVGSSNTVQEYYWLKNKYKKEYNAKLIILGFCLNDLFQNTYLRAFNPKKSNWALYKYLDESECRAYAGISPGIKQFLRKSRTISFIYRARALFCQKKALNNGLPPDRYDEVSQENKMYTELYLKKIKSFAESIGAGFVVVIFPREKQMAVDYNDTNRRSQDAVIEILERNHIKYIDLYGVMKEKYFSEPDIKWFHDDTHPYKAGHKLIGEYLAQELPQSFPKAFQ